MRLSYRAAVSTVALVLCLSCQAWAQTEDQASEAEDVDKVRSLDTVYVTAQRREETAQKAAIPVSVASSEELIRAGADNVSALNTIAPSLVVVQGSGANRSFFIRGVGNFSANGYTDAAIAVNIDGVYVGRPAATTATFLDLERVEVLKGPQGTLYGRNATGGAINILPARPVIGENSGYVSAGLGNFGSYEATGVGNFAVSDNTAVRLAATVAGNDGYLDDGTSQTEDFAVRGQIYSEFNADVSARFSIDYAESTGAGMGHVPEGRYVFAPAGSAGGPNDVPNYNYAPFPTNVADPSSGILMPAVQSFLASNIVYAPLFTFHNGNGRPYQNSTYFGANAEINISTQLGDLVVVPAYRESRIRGGFTGGPGFKLGEEDVKVDQTSLEARLSNSVGAVDWLLGGLYFNENVVGAAGFGSFTFNGYNIYDTGVDSYAAFGRAVLNVTDNFRLVGGIRYTEDKKTFDGYSQSLIALCLTPPPSGPGCFSTPALPTGLTIQESVGRIDPALLPAGPPSLSGMAPPVPYGNGAILLVTRTNVLEEQTFDKITYRLAAEYDLSPDNLLYASFETGYRSGGFSLGLGNETFEPELIDAITIGSKNRFFNDRLQLNLELFRWEYEDQQVSHFGVDSNGNTSYFTENIGKSLIQGFEVDTLFQMTNSTVVKANVQYLDTELTDFSYDNVVSSGLPTLSGCAVTPISGGSGTPSISDVNCAGKPAYNSPEWSINLGVEHEIEFDGFGVTFNVDGRYRGEQVIGFDYLPSQYEDAVTTVDVAVTLAPDHDRWFVTLFARNATDETIRVNQTSGNILMNSYAPPRTFGVRFGTHF